MRSQWRDASRLKELDGVLQEPLRILERRAVPGIGIDEELGVGDGLGQVPGIDRRDHDVVDAVQYQRRLLDRIQVGIGVVVERGESDIVGPSKVAADI
jgi:hypothetical protein